MSLLWRPWGVLERRYAVPEEATVYVILGFPRSGTSLVSRLVEQAGVSFGDKSTWRPADWRNPRGFYEHVEMLKIDERLVREAAFSSPYSFDNNTNLRAKGTCNRLRRMKTRVRMMKFLKKLHESGNPWAFKEFPFTFYFWKEYVPQAKLIGVFRDPHTNAHSVVRAFKRFTFRQVIDQWTAANRELLYHLATQESILIKLEDLADETKRETVLQKLISFLGRGDAYILTQNFEKWESETNKHKRDLTSSFPLPQETERVFNALNHLNAS